MPYPLPKTSVNALEAYRDKPPQNPSLLFSRFAPDWSGQSTIKKDGLEEVREAAKLVDKNLLEAWNKRWEAAVRAAGAEPLALKTDWRFVAGLGGKGPLEVGFTFHRYGFPILPGSSVKGIARAYAYLVEGCTESDPDFLAIFGRAPQKEEDESVAQSGGAVFFDAIPGQAPALELDVMNPHYPQYYQGNEPPADWQSPVPIYFLTVAPNTEFRFAVGWRGPLDGEACRLRSLAQDWLAKGLAELGAGAKTSAGYGYFLPQSLATSTAPKATAEPTSVNTSPLQTTSPVLTRQGVIVEIRPDKRFGRVRDAETGQEYNFSISSIEGDTPAKKSRVVFEVRDNRVVKVKRA